MIDYASFTLDSVSKVPYNYYILGVSSRPFSDT